VSPEVETAGTGRSSQGLQPTASGHRVLDVRVENTPVTGGHAVSVLWFRC
jgi:hypothetical protein